MGNLILCNMRSKHFKVPCCGVYHMSAKKARKKSATVPSWGLKRSNARLRATERLSVSSVAATSRQINQTDVAREKRGMDVSSFHSSRRCVPTAHFDMTIPFAPSSPFPLLFALQLSSSVGPKLCCSMLVRADSNF